MPPARIVIVTVLFVGAIGIRSIAIDEPQAGLSARSYTSAVIAHAEYVEDRHIPALERRIAIENGRDQPLIEPRIMEALAVAGYRAAGEEHLWIPRLVASIFWLIGGWFLFRIAVMTTTERSALIALGVYLFLPFSVEASRSFQPDSLMVAASLAAVWALVRYDVRRTWTRLLGAGALSGLAVLVKPGIAALPIGGAYLALAMAGSQNRWSWLSTRLVVFAALAAAPTALYFVFSEGVLSSQTEAKVDPQLLGTAFFWKQWAASVASVLGAPGPFAGKVIGAAVACLCIVGAWRMPRRALALTGGWVAGYLLLALVLSYNVATHPYYSLLLVPFAALSLGCLGDAFCGWVERKSSGTALMAASLAAVAALVVVLIPIARSYCLSPGGPALRREDPARVAEHFARIGGLVEHSPRVIVVDPGDGLALEYYGNLRSFDWPAAFDRTAADDTGDEIASVPTLLQRTQQFFDGQPQYFVTTDPPGLLAQGEVMRFLAAHGHEVARAEDYRVYKLNL